MYAMGEYVSQRVVCQSWCWRCNSGRQAWGADVSTYQASHWPEEGSATHLQCQVEVEGTSDQPGPHRKAVVQTQQYHVNTCVHSFH